MFFLSYFTATTFGRVVGIALVSIVVLFGTYWVGYYKGHVNGVAGYKAKIERAIGRAVQKGNKAEIDALKDFDKNPDGFTDPFERKDTE